MTKSQPAEAARLGALLSKVPDVTILFWVIKMLRTTVGETVADFINGRLGDNLKSMTAARSILPVVALVFQLRTPATCQRSTGSPSY